MTMDTPSPQHTPEATSAPEKQATWIAKHHAIMGGVVALIIIAIMGGVLAYYIRKDANSTPTPVTNLTSSLPVATGAIPQPTTSEPEPSALLRMPITNVPAPEQTTVNPNTSTPPPASESTRPTVVTDTAWNVSFTAPTGTTLAVNADSNTAHAYFNVQTKELFGFLDRYPTDGSVNLDTIKQQLAASPDISNIVQSSFQNLPALSFTNNKTGKLGLAVIVNQTIFYLSGSLLDPGVIDTLKLQ